MNYIKLLVSVTDVINKKLIASVETEAALTKVRSENSINNLSLFDSDFSSVNKEAILSIQCCYKYYITK